MYDATQRDYMDKVAALHGTRTPLAFVDTYGCQQNEADSEVLRGMLTEMGYAMTADEWEADLLVLNTCAVREHAEQRLLGNVGALTHTKKAKKSQLLVLCGCMMQLPHAIEKVKQSYRHVDLTFGPPLLPKFPELLWQLLSERGRFYFHAEHTGEILEGMPILRGDPPHAWMPIMAGCDNFCTYCIVPYVRGRERSRAPEDILREMRALADSGYTEFTLLGQNVNSYDGNGLDFSGLLREIEKLPGDFTLTFMTSHPKDATKQLFDTMADCRKVKRQLHLPFQAGSDRVLAAMNRGYTAAHYIELIRYARRVMPGLHLTSDVIVGFPGETEAEFEETLALIERVGFDNLFTFIYSPRAGTPAAEMDDPVPPGLKREWMARLLAVQKRVSQEKQSEGA